MGYVPKPERQNDLDQELTDSFSILSQVRLHYWMLGDAFCLSLCTTNDDYVLQMLDARQLL